MTLLQPADNEREQLPMNDENRPQLPDGPLSGVKVLDFTSVVVGPAATMVLADYGAEVIKVESPEGDILRRLGGSSRSGQLSPKFIQMNRSKRSLAIDLKSPEGRQAIRTLIESADIMVVNMRSAALAKLGLTFEDARALNPRIVHCAMMGFGRGGRHFDRPAYDSIIQGGGGIAACFERQTGEPQFVPMVLADHLVSVIAVQMILLALRARDQSGEAQSVEVPMFENVASFVLQEHLGQKAFEPARGEAGDTRLLDPNARPVRTRDGYLCVSANTDRQAHGFFAAIGRPDLATDPRFATVAARRENVAEYFELRNSSLAGKTTAEWMAAFERLDVPAFPFNSLDDLLEEPHLRETGLFETMEYPEEGTVRHMRPANSFTGGRRRSPTPAPALGENSAEVLRDAGLAEDRISGLVASGVIVAGPRTDRKEMPS